jgi:hypothetical protein
MLGQIVACTTAQKGFQLHLDVNLSGRAHGSQAHGGVETLEQGSQRMLPGPLL